MKGNGKEWLVIQRGGTIAEVAESQQDAVKAAERLAQKNSEEYFVYKPAKSIRPKPVEIVSEDL